MSTRDLCDLTVVIPVYRLEDDHDRKVAFQHVIERVHLLLCPRELIVVEHKITGAPSLPLALPPATKYLTYTAPRPFNKAKALNIGMRAATSSVVLGLDGDVVLDWNKIREEVKQMPKHGVCMPTPRFWRLNQNGTTKLLAGAPITTDDIIGKITVFGGAAFMIRRSDYWLLGGFDERYKYGWGVEDEGFGRMAKLLLNPYRLDAEAYHLYHPRSQEQLMSTESYRTHRTIYDSTLYPDRPVPGLAVIAAAWGSNPLRRKAIRQGLESWFASTDQPAVYIFCEAVAKGGTPIFPDNHPGAIVIRRELRPENSHLFQKEVLWGLAFTYLREHQAELPPIDRALCMDGDLIIPKDKLFFAKSALALEDHEVIQPFRLCTDSEIPSHLRTSLLSNLTDHGGKRIQGTPGYAYGVRLDVHQRVQGFKLCPTCAGDMLHFARLIPNGFTMKTDAIAPCLRRVAKYEAPAHRPTYGYVDLNLVHANHGPISNRLYGEQTALLTHACSHPGEIIQVGDNDLVRPTPTVLGRAFVKARQRLKEGSPREVRDLWDKAIREELPPINEEYPLKIVCVLRSGGEYNGSHVRWLAKQFTQHLKQPHEFYCLGDVDVRGVRTIPLSHALPTTRAKLEVFRADVFPDPNSSVLLVDLDTVLTRDFTLPRCPLRSVFYVRENERRKSWPSWNSSVVYFRPCAELNQLLTGFLADYREGRSPDWMFPGEQEWSSFYIYHHLREHSIMDIERLLAVRFFTGEVPTPPAEAHLVTWASPNRKPWRGGPSWAPKLGV